MVVVVVALIPYEHLAQRPRRLLVDEFLRVAQLDVHVAIDALHTHARPRATNVRARRHG